MPSGRQQKKTKTETDDVRNAMFFSLSFHDAIFKKITRFYLKLEQGSDKFEKKIS